MSAMIYCGYIKHVVMRVKMLEKINKKSENQI